ncbi:MAG: hypothetical protein NVSMB60_28200 [Mycobacterium sp.]
MGDGACESAFAVSAFDFGVGFDNDLMITLSSDAGAVSADRDGAPAAGWVTDDPVGIEWVDAVVDGSAGPAVSAHAAAQS